MLISSLQFLLEEMIEMSLPIADFPANSLAMSTAMSLMRSDEQPPISDTSLLLGFAQEFRNSNVYDLAQADWII